MAASWRRYDGRERPVAWCPCSSPRPRAERTARRLSALFQCRVPSSDCANPTTHPHSQLPPQNYRWRPSRLVRPTASIDASQSQAPRPRRERKFACAAAGAQNNKMPPDDKLCDLHSGVCDGSEVAPIGPIIGHSDRAKSEQNFRAITPSISTTASMDTTPHENAHMRTSSDSPQPAIIGRR